MIKRRDLVKQFELAVQQEIINHNKAISENNIKFNEVNKKIESLEIEDSKKNERLVAKLNTLSCQLEDNKAHFKEAIRCLDSKNNDRSALSSRKIDSNSTSVSQIRYNLNAINKFEDKIRELFQKYSDLERLFTDLYSKTHSKIEKLERNYIKLLELHKEETKAKPTEINKLDKKISNEIDICAVNIDCNGQSLSKLQKRCFVMEKHIERLETHLNRLEGKV